MIERVTSTDDPRLDAFRHVGDPAWIRQRNLFVAEGRLVVERVIALGRFDVEAILVNHAAHHAMLDQLSRVGAPVLVCDDAALTPITGFNFHRGCLALVARPPASGVDELIQSRRLLGAESVSNPDNIGGLFRTAAAFGVDGVVLDASSADPLYRKAVRTSMGASLRVPYVRVEDWVATLRRFRDAGLTIAALTPAAGALDLNLFAGRLHADERLLLLVGAEGSGLRAESLKAADVCVRIPVTAGVDSLNVVVAAGIAMHRLR